MLVMNIRNNNTYKSIWFSQHKLLACSGNTVISDSKEKLIKSG